MEAGESSVPTGPPAHDQPRKRPSFVPHILWALLFIFFCAVGVLQGKDARGLLIWAAICAAGVATAAGGVKVYGLVEAAAKRRPARARPYRVVLATLAGVIALGALTGVVGFVVLVWRFGMFIFPVMFGG